MYEIPFDLPRDRTTGTIRVSGFQAILEQVRWWTHTPRWSKINKPNWGHEFENYLNEVMTTGILQDIEARTIIGIENDIDVKIPAVYARPTMADALCDIYIAVSDGTEIGIVADRIIV